MIKSMTAFAEAEKTGENGTAVSVEIRGLNSRYLDLAVRTPSSYSRLEEFIKQRVKGKIFRGRVEIRAGIREPEAETKQFLVNRALAENYHGALEELRTHLGIRETPGLSHIIGAPGIIETREEERDLEKISVVLGRAIDEAMESFDAMRAAEGRSMAEDLYQRLQFVEGCIKRIDSLSSDLPELKYERLHKRIQEMTRQSAEIDESRLAQEAAFIADKCDISEEIARARSHAAQFKKIMESDEPAGKPLNFLLQEFGREFNTMGAKASSAEISHEVVAAKTELEKLREQVQNIE